MRGAAGFAGGTEKEESKFDLPTCLALMQCMFLFSIHTYSRGSSLCISHSWKVKPPRWPGIDQQALVLLVSNVNSLKAGGITPDLKSLLYWLRVTKPKT